MAQTISRTRKDEELFTGEWLRKASEDEIFMEKCHQDGHMVTWYQLSLSSLEPLQEEDIRMTFKHFYRKVPNVSVCYGVRNDEMWLRRATNPNVDFKVLQGLSLEEVRESLRRYHYNSNTGPLFCGRLLRDAKDTDEGYIDLEPCFPSKCHIFFGLHHGITDGYSTMCMMGFFVSILNDVLAKSTINDDELLGYLATTEAIDRLIMGKMAILEEDPALQKKIGREIDMKRDEAPLVIKAFPSPNKEHGNRTYVKILDENITSKFIQRCRREQVTVNSTITAISNMAIMDVLVQHGLIQDSYIIRNYHCVNARRYWNSDDTQCKALGCHLGVPLALYTETPHNVHDDFWLYSKNLGDQIKNDVSTGRVFDDKAYNKLFPQPAADTGKAWLGERSCYSCDFLTSGMGDVTSLVTEGGEHAKVTHLVRSTSCHVNDNPLLINCHTFRGRMMLSFEYNTLAILASVAESIFSKIIEGLIEVTS